MEFVLPNPVTAALDALNRAGFAAYAVGGCVRDHVLGVTPHDYDICTAAPPEEMKRVFAGERTVETGIQHGTLTVLLSGMPLEITTFRVDGEYLDGRHPASVRFADRVEEDLSRRDFTMNAMAYAPGVGLVDPFGGREDCKRGVLRCVGEAELRFGEDALRILRALRFSARLGFPIEEKTAKAAREGRGMLSKISRERIAAELTGTITAAHAAEVLAAFPEVLCAAVPELADTVNHETAWPRVLRTLSLVPTEPALRWAALLLESPAGRPDAPGDVMRELKMPNKLTDTVRRLVDFTRRYRTDCPSVHVRLMHLGPEETGLLLSLQEADAVSSCPDTEAAIREEYRQMREELARLIAENACYSLRQLAVSGRDMAAAGLRGAKIGQTLNELLLRVAREELPNERDALLEAVRSGI